MLSISETSQLSQIATLPATTASRTKFSFNLIVHFVMSLCCHERTYVMQNLDSNSSSVQFTYYNI